MTKGKRPSGWKPNAKHKEQLRSFDGFGPEAPDVIFIGLEEYCSGDHEQQRDNVWIRCTSSTYSQRADRETALRELAGLVKTDVPVWDFMAKIMARLTGRTEAVERKNLGSRPPKTRPSSWLTELRPYPRPGLSFKWEESYLEEWFSDEFNGKAAFEKAPLTLGPRVRQALQQSPAPKLLFAYGAGSRRWAESCLLDLLEVDQPRWRSVTLPKLVSASSKKKKAETKPRNDPGPRTFQIGRTRNNTVLVLTDFFEGQHPSKKLVASDLETLIANLKPLLGAALLEPLVQQANDG